MNYKYVLNDKFWIEALENDLYIREVVKLFYSHSFDSAIFSSALNVDVLTERQVWDIILKILIKKSCRQILEILEQECRLFPIDKADICQFSNFDDCYYRVIDLIIRSGIEGITWEKMGFLLRTTPRTRVADTKYGENHGKTAVQLGLCQMDKHHRFWATTMGECFNSLCGEDKEVLRPKQCLYIPIVHNYFVCGEDKELMEGYFSLLSESTSKRRRPNINRLINLVKEAL